MYALARLPAAAGGRVGNEVYQRRAGKRIGVASGRRRAWNDSERQQVVAAVVADAYHLVRLRARAGEIRELHIRLLTRPVAGAELRQRRSDSFPRSWRCPCRLVSGVRFAAQAGVSATLARHWGRGGVGGGGGAVLGHALAEYRDADHADIGRATGAGGVGVGHRGELEGGNFRLALAPAGDLVGFLSMQHVAALVPAGGITGEDIDTVDRSYRQ